MQKMRKAMALLLALAMVFTLFTGIDLTASAEDGMASEGSVVSAYSEAPLLTTETPATVAYAGTEASGVLRFIPTGSGRYTFTSSGSSDTYVSLYDENGEFLDSDDDSGAGSNFKLTKALEAGKTYFIFSRLYRDRESAVFTVYAIEEKEIVSLSLSLKDPSATLTTGIGGYWGTYYDDEDKENRYFNFDEDTVLNILDIHVTYADNTTAVLPYDASKMSCSGDRTKWTVGGRENTFTVNYEGLSASISVPVQSFAQKYADAPLLTTETPVEVAYDGTEASGILRFVPSEEGRYTFRSAGNCDTFVELFDDGGYRMDYDNDSGEDSANFDLVASLEAGKTYFLFTRLSYSSSTGNYTVSAVKNKKIKTLSLLLKDPSATLTTGSGGYWTSYYDYDTYSWKEYYCFYDSTVLDILNICVTYTDETTEILPYKATTMSCASDQWKWTPGGTENSFTLTYEEINASIAVPVQTFAGKYAAATTLTTDGPAAVVYDGTEDSGVLRFIPTVEGRYIFRADGDCDTYATLYDENGNYLNSGNYGGTGTNFELKAKLEAGKTYFLFTRLSYSSSTGNYTVSAVREKEIKSLSLSLKDSTSALTVGVDGYWRYYYDDHGERRSYFFFSGDTVFSILDIHAVFDDDTAGVIPYQSDRMYYSADQANWTVGGSENTFTLYCEDLSASIFVPVQSFAQKYAAAPLLTTETPVTVAFDGTKDSGVLRFVAETDGRYSFKSTGKYGAAVTLYDENGDWVNDYTYVETNNNFELTVTLEAGKTIFLFTECYSDEDDRSYTVSATKEKIIKSLSLSLQDPSSALTVGVGGRWSTYGGNPYYCFDEDTVLDILEIHATYEDDTSAVIPYKSSVMSCFGDQQNWTAGGSENTFTVTYEKLSASISVPIQNFSAKYTSAPLLKAGESIDVSFDETEDSGVLRFVPTVSCRYGFESKGDRDTYVTLYDENGKELVSDDDSGDGANFYLLTTLEAGKTYLLFTRLFSTSSAGKYTVSATHEKEIKTLSLSLVNPSATLTVGIGGYWIASGDNSYYYFDDSTILDILNINVVYDDDTTAVIPYRPTLMKCSSAQQNWTVGGNKNTFTIAYGRHSASISVPIQQFSAKYTSAPLLTTARPVSVTYDSEQEDSGVLRFIPTESGLYSFRSDGNCYAFATLFDEDGRYVMDGSSSSIGGKENNFHFYAKLEAGKTFILSTGGFESSSDSVSSEKYGGTYTVSATKEKEIRSISLSLKDPSATLSVSIGGYWSTYENNPYYEFYSSTVLGILNIQATYADGTTAVIPFHYSLMSYSDDQREWTVGGSKNLFTVICGDSSATIAIPVQSFADALAAKPALTPDVPQDVSYDGSEFASLVSFTPEESGVYYFYSTGNCDTYATLCDSNGEMLYDPDTGEAVTGDDYGITENFVIARNLEAGKTYALFAETYDSSSGEFRVVVSRTRPTFGMATLEDMDLSGKTVNLLLAVDTTGSMDWILSRVRTTLKGMIASLSKTNVQFRISLIDYKDIEEQGTSSTVLHRNSRGGVWFENGDIDDLIGQIEALSASGDSDYQKSVIDALGNVVDPAVMTVDPETATFAFLITNGNFKAGNTHGITDMNDLIARLKEKGIATSVVTPKSLFPYYRSLTAGTGGVLLNADTDFAVGMDAFSAAVASGTADFGHTHTFGEWKTRTAATCMATGIKFRVCSVCGEEETDKIPATGHSWSAWSVTKAATCTAAGMQTRTCKNDKAHKETKAIAATGHKMTYVAAKAATTTATGNKAYYKCSVCGKLFTDKDGKTETTLEKVTIAKLAVYTITYKLDGGKNSSANPAKYNVTTATITLKNPTKTGYTFKGWYSDAKFKIIVTKIVKGSTGNKILYAKWAKNSYTLTYKLDGGKNGSNPKTYTVTDAITLKNPTKAGYTFKGWYSDAKFKTKVTKIAKGSTGNKTLYAKWQKNTYKITYKLNGGTNGKNPKTYTVTDTVALKKPVKKGYTFGGWYSDAKFKKKVIKITKGSTGNKTLYAKWVKK